MLSCYRRRRSHLLKYRKRLEVRSQSEIFCLIACSFSSRERIFHFGRVCWSWKSNSYIRTERTRALRQNISGQYIHMSRENDIHINTSRKLCKIRFSVTSQKSSLRGLRVFIMKTSNFRVLDNFPKLFPKPRSITFISSNFKQEWKALNLYWNLAPHKTLETHTSTLVIISFNNI